MAAVGVVVTLALWLARPTTEGKPAPLSRVDTQDVHALAFLGSPDRLILGHHAGILESNDGGRTWSPWGTGSDAMALGVAGERPVIVAGHDVLAVGRPDGHWQHIANDLPHNDIHGFARDPANPDRMWAYLATGGLYESQDGGTHWEQASAGHTIALLAVTAGDGTRLLAVDPDLGAIVASDDGGRNWQRLAAPPDTPVYAMAAARDGATILLSGAQGLFRSDDGGTTFAQLVDVGEPILAIAASDDASTIVLATRDRVIYRSDDGGETWAPGG